jgi:hypothetical protein
VGKGLFLMATRLATSSATRGDDTPIRIRDLGEVTTAPMVRLGATTRDGRDEVMTGVAMMPKRHHGCPAEGQKPMTSTITCSNRKYYAFVFDLNCSLLYVSSSIL